MVTWISSDQINQKNVHKRSSARGLAIFQSIPSIRPKLAQLVIDMGYYSFEMVKHETGVELTNRAEEYHGYLDGFMCGGLTSMCGSSCQSTWK